VHPDAKTRTFIGNTRVNDCLTSTISGLECIVDPRVIGIGSCNDARGHDI
jgi:hypothetical protein